jgi:hypothetical protein
MKEPIDDSSVHISDSTVKLASEQDSISLCRTTRFTDRWQLFLGTGDVVVSSSL